MKIPQKRLEQVLNAYNSECRYLIEAKSVFPKAEGVFHFKDTFYMNPKERLQHMTAIETQFCLNQLSYSAFGEWTAQGRFEKFTISFDEYIELMKENMFILDSLISFRKPINTENPVHGMIEVTRIKNHGNLYLAFLDFNISDGKCKGKMKAALKK